jgi:hypothetical protein
MRQPLCELQPRDGLLAQAAKDTLCLPPISTVLLCSRCVSSCWQDAHDSSKKQLSSWGCSLPDGQVGLLPESHNNLGGQIKPTSVHYIAVVCKYGRKLAMVHNTEGVRKGNEASLPILRNASLYYSV